MRRDVGPSVVSARNNRRSDESHAPVLGLKLHRVHVGPDGHHTLAREAGADLGEAKVKRQTAAEDSAGQGPGRGGDDFEVAVGSGGDGAVVEERLDHGQ